MVVARQMSFSLSEDQEEYDILRQFDPRLLSFGKSGADSRSSIQKYEKQVQSACLISSPQVQELLERKPLGSTYTPGSFDVICAKGTEAKQHTGNRRFRILIEMNLQRYKRAGKSRAAKSRIVTDIVDAIQASSPEGGFVQMCGGEWYQVSEHHAREKVGQSFRDRLHQEYKSSSKAKIQRRKMTNKKPNKCCTMPESSNQPSSKVIPLAVPSISTL